MPKSSSSSVGKSSRLEFEIPGSEVTARSQSNFYFMCMLCSLLCLGAPEQAWGPMSQLWGSYSENNLSEFSRSLP